MGAVRLSMCTYRRQWVSATVYSVICGPADAGAPGQEVENVLAHGITHPMGSTQKPLLAALGKWLSGLPIMRKTPKHTT